MFARGPAWTLMSFKTRMLRQWKDFLWMGHIGISASKKRPFTVEDHY